MKKNMVYYYSVRDYNIIDFAPYIPHDEMRQQSGIRSYIHNIIGHEIKLL